MDWNDPAQRAHLAERVGPAEYNRLFEENRQASIVSRVNGYEIRPVHSGRFGKLYMIEGTGTAYIHLDLAEDYARGLPKGDKA